MYPAGLHHFVERSLVPFQKWLSAPQLKILWFHVFQLSISHCLLFLWITNFFCTCKYHVKTLKMILMCSDNQMFQMKGIMLFRVFKGIIKSLIIKNRETLTPEWCQLQLSKAFKRSQYTGLSVSDVFSQKVLLFGSTDGNREIVFPSRA